MFLLHYESGFQLGEPSLLLLLTLLQLKDLLHIIFDSRRAWFLHSPPNALGITSLHCDGSLSLHQFSLLDAVCEVLDALAFDAHVEDKGIVQHVEVLDLRLKRWSTLVVVFIRLFCTFAAGVEARASLE